MENVFLDIINNVGFPIAVSVILFYQSGKTSETYLNLYRNFQEVIDNNTKSIELLNQTVQELKYNISYKDGVKNEVERP